jgi:pimeloyl-ACP methyl ester carboxylesterase
MNSHMRAFILCSLVLAVGLLGACSEDPVSPKADSENFVAAVTENAVVESVDYISYTGVIGGANLYEVRVPADWNGELVLYAHGFVDAAEPVQLPDKDNIDAIRDGLVGQGFAFAACSFRENGFAVKDGAWSTRTVHQIFRSKVKQAPSYTWLMGQSLGALVAVQLVENHPRDYDGVVTAAGMLGGSRAEIDYMGDVRVLFDMFYPGILPGSVCEPVAIADQNQIVMAVVGAVTADPEGLGVISRVLPLPGRDANELVQSLVTAIVFNYRGQPDLFERTGGRCPYDNRDRVYAERWPGALPPGVTDMINAGVPRYSRSVPVDGVLDRQYEPTGRLEVEMLTLHLAHDPIVPAVHEQLYREKVAATGNEHLLEQRVLDGYGHTLQIDPQEIVTALLDLRDRVVPGPVAVTR